MRKKFFLGIFFAVKRSPKKGGIVHAFDVCSDGLSPDPDLGNFGLKHWHFKEFFSYWTYATLNNGDT